MKEKLYLHLNFKLKISIIQQKIKTDGFIECINEKSTSTIIYYAGNTIKYGHFPFPINSPDISHLKTENFH